jgi:hypothetical protein
MEDQGRMKRTQVAGSLFQRSICKRNLVTRRSLPESQIIRIAFFLTRIQRATFICFSNFNRLPQFWSAEAVIHHIQSDLYHPGDLVLFREHLESVHNTFIWHSISFSHHQCQLESSNLRQVSPSESQSSILRLVLALFRYSISCKSELTRKLWLTITP